MSPNKKIVIVGSLNIDLVVRTSHLPKPGQTVRGRAFGTYPGGKGANQAVAAARLAPDDITVHMVGRVGQDGFGTTLLQSLSESGVDVDQVKRVPGATGNAMIAVEESGENFIIITAAANSTLTAGDMDDIAPLLQDAEALLLQLEIPLPAIERAAAIAAKAGALVILNPAPAPEKPLPSRLLGNVSILAPNETEARALTGQDDPLKAIVALHELGLPTVVLTQGAAGALIAQGGDIEHVPAFPVTSVDTTAAGDAFVGALSVALIEGRSPKQSVRFAAAAGALAATKAGAQPSLPRRQQLLSFMVTKDHG
ncbi:MAG: ribokinase [Chloroflexota bacterium]|jgi:ribokinase